MATGGISPTQQCRQAHLEAPSEVTPLSMSWTRHIPYNRRRKDQNREGRYLPDFITKRARNDRPDFFKNILTICAGVVSPRSVCGLNYASLDKQNEVDRLQEIEIPLLLDKGYEYVFGCIQSNAS